MPDPGDITLLLQRAGAGDRDAADALYRLVEKDLRAIAGRRKRRFDNPADGSTTVLVDDAFCRVLGRATAWAPGDRGKFFSYVASKIHDLLVEAARARLAQKRGGGRRRVDLEALDPAAVGAEALEDGDFILDLKDALDRLHEFAADESTAFRIYYFLGCTFEETAEVLQLSATEVKRRVRKAQMWLQRELKGYGHES